MRLFKKKSVLKDLDYGELTTINTIDVCPGEYSDKEWEFLNIENSIENKRPYGIIQFNDKGKVFTFYKSNVTIDLRTLEYGKDFKFDVNSMLKTFSGNKPTMTKYYQVFPLAVVPKNKENHPNWMVSTMHELLAYYDLYLPVPGTTINHPKHFKNYEGKNICNLLVIK